MTSNAKKRPSKSKIKNTGKKCYGLTSRPFAHAHTTPGFKQPLVITCSVESVGKFYWEYWAGSYASYAAYLMLQKGSDVVKCWGFFFFSPSLSLFSLKLQRGWILPEKWKKKQNLRQRDIHPHPKNPQPESPQKPQTKSTPRKPRTTGLQKGSPKVTLKNRAYFILKKCSSLASVFWHN